ncbi:MAG: hypothetical protein HN742_38975 [Lentisphaerae bacterium]|mgnify:CR=1 FL=1|jgi:hypothetical protein|nr:hypothetical protein [Lentisphaerota bacterium]MBT5604667.1 hypothetical protein [Lentisphaerota bacterium]MBT7057372.1 hypothetical protein [Lentisphaerota bacterium]MBT7847915.1 hypothetical protein [Lentisphaerota bacterium]
MGFSPLKRRFSTFGGWLFAVALGLLLAAPGGMSAEIVVADLTYAVQRRPRRATNDYALSFKASPVFERLDVVFWMTSSSDFGRLRWDADGYHLLQTRGGVEEALLRGTVPLPVQALSGGTLLLRSRPHWFEVIVSGKRIFRVLGPGGAKGQVACATGPGFPEVAEAGYQSVEDVVFGDDFMRTEEETSDFGLWEPAGGEWRLHSVMEEIRANPDARIREGREPVADRSSNPFSLSGKAAGEAFISTGHPFWADYRVGVSVKPVKGAFGLAFGVSDPKNFWLLRWRLSSLGVLPGRLELIRRDAGADELVADAWVAGRIENWYRLEARTQGDLIEVLVDGSVVLTHRDARSTGGRIGLYAADGETFFDDVSCETWHELRFDQLASLEGQGQAVKGQWDVAEAGGTLVLAATGEGTGPAAGEQVYMLGGADWERGCFRAQVSLEKDQEQVGLCFGGKDTENVWRVGWRRDSEGALFLQQIASGEVTETATFPAAKLPLDGSTHELLLDLRSEGDVLFFVDGVLGLRGRVEGDRVGRVGLFAQGGGNTRFSGVQAYAEPTRDWEHPVNVDIFVDDPFMQGWASPRWAWIEQKKTDGTAYSPKRYVHKGDFYGAFRISAPVSDGVTLRFGGDEVNWDEGWALRFSVDPEKGVGKADVSRPGMPSHSRSFKLKAKTILPGKQIVDEKIGALPRTPDTVSYGTFRLVRHGHLLWVSVEGDDLLTLHSDVPLTGRAVGLVVGESLDHVHVSVQRSQVRDYLFEKAPVDWLKVGEWEVTNRFACDPRWSHMNGRSRGVAALWNKFAFKGNYTLECYAGMRMRQGDLHEGGLRNYYPRVGDINVAFARERRELFSGYNAILAAWDPMWSERRTQFWRRGDVLEQTEREFIPRGREKRPTARAIEVEWDPGGRPVHGAWYYIKARRTDGRFDVWFDNVPVFSVTDPEPLPTKWLALWTQHNSIVVARAKIGYETMEIPDFRTPAPPPDPSVALPLTGPRPDVLLSSHPGRFFDFEDGVQGWTPMSGDQSAETSIREAGPEGGDGHVLALRNLHAGGDFGVRLPVQGIDLDRVLRIEMDAAVPADVNVNLYVTFEDEPFERVFVALSGPTHEGANLVALGTFDGATSDDKWHHMRFDVGKALRRRFPWRERLVVKDMVLAMLHEGYLNSGLKGNPEGAVFALDNVLLTGVGTNRVHLGGASSEDNGDAMLLTARRERGGSSSTSTENAAAGELALDEPGAWFVQGTKTESGAAAASRPVPVWAAKALSVASTVPEDGALWGGEPIVVRFDQATVAELVPEALSLSVSGKTILLDSTNATYDPVARQLTVDPAAHLNGVDDGEVLELVLRYGDTATRGQPEPEDGKGDVADGAKKGAATFWQQAFTWRVTVAQTADTYPPSRPILTRDDYTRIDFDTGLDGVSPFSDTSHVHIERIARRGEIAGHALRILNRVCGSDVGIRLFRRDFPVGAHPLLVFDYRTGEHARADFQIGRRGKPWTIGFTDREEGEQALGSIPGIERDEKWHTARVDLAGMMDISASKAFSSKFTAQGLALGDWGHMAVPPGVSFEIDNINLVPAVSTREPFELAWAATDVSGIKGYSYAWDASPEFVVDRIADGTEGKASFGTLPEGEVFFHVRALDGAGNWGDASKYMFLVDNAPPEVASVTPANGARSASSTVTIAFAKDVTRIDPATVKLRLNGKKCSLSAYTTKWDGAKRALSWDVLNAWRVTREAFPDGKDMTFRLEGVQDFAGNTLTPYEWTWHVDHSQDKTGPGPPRLLSYTHDFRYYDHFTDATGYWRPYGRGNSAEVSTVVDPDTNDSCLQVSRAEKGRVFSAYRYRGNLGLSDYPLMAFDCKIVPGARVDVLLYIEKKWRPVRMTGPANGDEIGRVEEVKDDGKWRHIAVDIGAIIKEEFKDAEELPGVRMVGFGDVSGKDDGGMTGPQLFIDNFAFLGAASPVPVLSCLAADITGVQGFEISVDRESRGVPVGEMSTLARQAPLAAVDGPGVWFIHARAQDGAGNWGATAHYPYYCPNPVPRPSADGIEADGTWQVVAERRRSRSSLQKVSSVSGTNRLLVAELYGAARRTVRLRADLPTPVALTDEMVLAADFYHHADEPIEVSAYLTPKAGGKSIKSEPVSLSPKDWHRAIRFRFPKGQIPQGVGTVKRMVGQIDFALTPQAKVRDAFLVDSVAFASEKAPVPATPK